MITDYMDRSKRAREFSSGLIKYLVLGKALKIGFISFNLSSLLQFIFGADF